MLYIIIKYYAQDNGIFSLEKNYALPFATTWINLEDIMLSEVRHRKTDTAWSHLHVESKMNSQKQGVKGWFLGAQRRRESGMSVKAHKVSVMRDLMYSNRTIANDTILYTWHLLNSCVLATKKEDKENKNGNYVKWWIFWLPRLWWLYHNV